LELILLEELDFKEFKQEALIHKKKPWLVFRVSLHEVQTIEDIDAAKTVVSYSSRPQVENTIEFLILASHEPKEGATSRKVLPKQQGKSLGLVEE